MDILTNKNILLGITGSIAAYKAADIASRLKKVGCNIKVVMTKSSELFITETTLESLSGNKVISEDFKRLKNVFLLPHMGSSTLEGRLEMGEKVILNIKTFVDGHRPSDQIVPSML